MIRPDKRAHEIFVASQAHEEAHAELLAETRASAGKQALVAANVGRMRNNEHLRPEQVEAINQGAMSLIQQDLQAKATRVIEAMTALAAAEALETLFLCPQCGKEFANGAHVDILVVSVVRFDESGRALPERIDFGIAEVFNTQMGRRIKFCAVCMETWAIQPEEYVNMR